MTTSRDQQRTTHSGLAAAPAVLESRWEQTEMELDPLKWTQMDLNGLKLLLHLLCWNPGEAKLTPVKLNPIHWNGIGSIEMKSDLIEMDSNWLKWTQIDWNGIGPREALIKEKTTMMKNLFRTELNQMILRCTLRPRPERDSDSDILHALQGDEFFLDDNVLHSGMNSFWMIIYSTRQTAL